MLNLDGGVKLDERATQFSPCRRYRYTLWREWSEGTFGIYDRAQEYLMVIGLNPSTADETKDDPTIRKCIGFAKHWGFGALCMTNLFAWRDTKPENMMRADDPIGEDNTLYLARLSVDAGMVLAAWGKGGSFKNRATVIASSIPNLMCLRKNNDGSPEHPLYVPYETAPQPFP